MSTRALQLTSLLLVTLAGSSVAFGQARPADTTRRTTPQQTQSKTPPQTQTKATTPPATQTKATTPANTQSKAPANTQSKAPANVPAGQAKTSTPPAGQTKATTPPAGQTKAATPPAGGRGAAAPGAAGNTQRPADTALAAPLVLMREVFEYDSEGRRDPFISLLTTTDLRPTLSDLKLLMTVVDEPGRSVALVKDAYDKKQPQKTLRVGMRLGRMRVSSIRSDAVVFTIEEFGMNRRDSLLLRDTTRVR